MIDSVSPERPELRRVLGLWDSVSIILGIVIGAGIFFTPTSIANELHGEGIIVALWVLGGFMSLCGAMAYAELSSAWPATGGQYVFLRECWGPLVSFVFGWGQLVVIRPAGVAAVAVVFAQYVAYFIPVPQAGIKLIAILGITAVSILNYLGVRLTIVVQNVLTSVKVLTLILIAVAVFWATGGPPSGGAGAALPELGLSMWSSLGLALVGVFWTYDGWVEITAVAGEVKDPRKTIPRSLMISVLATIVLYVLVNVAFLKILGLDGVKDSPHVAADAMIRVLGPAGGTMIALAVIISTFGGLNGVTLTGPRVFFAMAVDGVFFSWFKKIHPRFKTPSAAIGLQALLGVPLVVTWTFDQLTTYFVFASLIFYSITTAAVFRLRRMPNAPKPAYRTWGYPFTPLVFIVISTGILVNTVVRSPVQATVGGAILLAGVPIFYIWKRSNVRSKS